MNVFICAFLLTGAYGSPIDPLPGMYTYYLIKEWGLITILKFLRHPDLIFHVMKIFFAPLIFHVINEKIKPTLFAYYLLFAYYR